MWIVPWDPFLMKKLLKSVICGSVNSAYIHCSCEKVNICGYCSMNSNRNCWLSAVNSAHMHCSRTHKLHFLSTFSLKMGPTVLFTHLKIILLQCFQSSVFSFSKISSIQTHLYLIIFIFIELFTCKTTSSRLDKFLYYLEN